LKLNVVYGGGATEGYTRYEIKPSSIRVSGSDAVLADLSEIVLGTVNFAEQTENAQMSFPINLPEGVTNLTGITEATAEIRFVGLSIKEYTVEKIAVVNVPEGLAYELMNEVVKVTLRGPVALINQIDAEDIVVTVDLSGKEIGASTVKAHIAIKGDKFTDVGALGTHSVSVTLKEAETE
jgi:YbbR domain-containing protein